MRGGLIYTPAPARLTSAGLIYESNSVAQTESVAAELALRLRPGDVIALDGDLGAGKTQFVRGLVAALGGDPRTVSSPTFVLLHIYDCRALKVFHIDAYRLGSEADLDSIGFAELLDQGGVTVIEWASRVSDALPGRRTAIRIDATGETSRRIEIVE